MKRVLIITYYWPPSAGSGVQRWLKLSKYLPEHGWQPVIYTPENPDFDLKDDTLLRDVSPHCEIVKRRILEPYHLAKMLTGKKKLNTGIVTKKEKQSRLSRMMNWVRGNLFIPDPRVIWVKPSIRFLKKYLKENPVDAIITTGPPHSMHLIGLGIKRALGIPWVVDIRDPFSKLDFLDTFNVSDRSRKKYQKMEQVILSTCDNVIATSYSMPEMLEDFDVSKFKTITNGFDSEDFEGLQRSTSDATYLSSYTIYHAGLLNALRNPRHLWTAISNVKNLDIKIQLVGTIDPSVIEIIKSSIGDRQELVLEGYKSHDEVLQDYKRADVLLLLVNESYNSKVNIPGKLFEYLAMGKTIIAIGKPTDDAIKLISDLGFATFDYSHQITSDELVDACSRKPIHQDIDMYSRKSTASVLARLLEALKNKDV